MKHTDAAKILGLSGEITPDRVKEAFRQSAKKYHPDINPAGAEMMKVINASFECLKDYTGTLEEDLSEDGYTASLNEALNAIITCSGLSIEVCGAWVWVIGDTFKHKKILKESGFRYASKKQSWYFRPEDWKSYSRGNFSMSDIRDRYGSNGVAVKPSKKLIFKGE